MHTSMPAVLRVFVLALCLVSLSACHNTRKNVERDILVGTAGGAAIGAAIGAAGSGCFACGALIGGAVGAGMGLLYNRLEGRQAGR